MFDNTVMLVISNTGNMFMFRACYVCVLVKGRHDWQETVHCFPQLTGLKMWLTQLGRHIGELILTGHNWNWSCFLQLCISSVAVISERELTFTFAIRCRPSVCYLSVCNIRAPYSAGWNFRQCFYVVWCFGHPWHPQKILQKSSEGNPSVAGLNARWVAKYSDFGPIEGYLRNGARYCRR